MAAVNSLANCLEECPEFVIDQMDCILKTALSGRRLGILHSYLIDLQRLPRQHHGYLLQCLNHWFTEEILDSLRDDKTFGELLILLKIVAEVDPRQSFDLSNRIPRINKGVAGGQATVYDQIAQHSRDEALLLEVLESVVEVSKFNQVRMSNALRRILPALDRKLGGRKVVEMIFRTYKDIEDKQALKTFIEAALKVTSWMEEDTVILLQNSDLPGSVRGLLAAKLKR